MSAYLVQTKTIDRIITGLDYELRDDRMLQIKMEQATGISINMENWQDKIGCLMLNLNQMALGERYNDKMVEHTYKYYPQLGTNIQNLKSLQCYTYQCAEGAIIETKMYKFFDSILERKFMTRIIYSMSQYDSAEWA